MRGSAQTYADFKQAYGRTKRQPCCSGCGQTFESYGMTADEGFEADGLIYCNSDCHLESSEKERDLAEWESAGEEW